jgi:hypothetical protein
VALGVGDPVPLPDPVCDGVALLDRDVLPVLDCDAPEVSEAVGEALSVLEAERVEEGVGGGVGVALPLEEPVLLGVADCEAVALLDSDVLPELDSEDSAVRDAVDEALIVVFGEGEGVPLLVTVAAADGVAVRGAMLLAGDAERGAAALLEELLRVSVEEGELLPEAVGRGVVAALALPVPGALAVLEGLTPAAREGAALALRVELALGVAVGEGEGEGEGEGRAGADMLTEAEVGVKAPLASSAGLAEAVPLLPRSVPEVVGLLPVALAGGGAVVRLLGVSVGVARR